MCNHNNKYNQIQATINRNKHPSRMKNLNNFSLNPAKY